MDSLVETFQIELEELERERSKVLRDRRGILFVSYLFIVLGTACLLSGWIGESSGIMSFAAVLFALALIPKIFGGLAGARYREKFREKVTRPWFKKRFAGVFLGPPSKEPTPEFIFMHREAWSFLANWSPTPLRVVDRIFFDREEENSHVGTFSTFMREYLVFMKKREGEAPVPDAFVSALGKHGKVRVRSNEEGLWVALRLPRRLFPAPIDRPTSDPDSYIVWIDDAKILLDPDVRLGWIAAR